MRYLKGVNTLEYEGTSFHAPGIGKSYKAGFFSREFYENSSSNFTKTQEKRENSKIQDFKKWTVS